MENESRVTEGIIAVLNETVSNVSKSFFSGLKDLKKKTKQKTHFCTRLCSFMSEKAWLYEFALPWGPPLASPAHYKYLDLTVRQ